MAGLDEFEKGLEEFEKEVEQEMVEIQKKITTYAFKRLVSYSPSPRKSVASFGSYVLSHRIGLNRKNPNTTVIGTAQEIQDGTVISAYGASEKAFSKELGRLTKLKPFSIIKITNNISYVDNVEYGKWPWKKAKRKGYYPFTKANADVETAFAGAKF